MPAPPAELRASLSTSGYHDGLGRRTLIFDREDGAILERLHLRPEFRAFEEALRERMDCAAAFDDERLARVRGIERDPADGGLTVVSKFVSGNRVSDLLEAAAALSADEAASPSVDAALGFLLEILPALAALHASGFTHGAVGPGRTLLTPTAQVVLLDSVFGHVLQRLRFNRRRLWTEFRIAMPASSAPPTFDVSADIAQASLTGLMIVIGRLLHENEYPQGLAPLLSEVIEIAQIRGTATFASGLQKFFERTLPFPGRQPYDTADEAIADLRKLADEIGIDRCQAALTTFVTDMNRLRDRPFAEDGGFATSFDTDDDEDAEDDAEAVEETEFEDETTLEPVLVIEPDLAPIAVSEPEYAAPLSYAAASSLEATIDLDLLPDPITPIESELPLRPIASFEAEREPIDPEPTVQPFVSFDHDRELEPELVPPPVPFEQEREPEVILADAFDATRWTKRVQIPAPNDRFEPGRPWEPPAPLTREAPPQPEAVEPEPLVAQERYSAPPPAPVTAVPAPVPAAAAPTKPEADASRRKQRRGSKKDRDKLRSNAAPARPPVFVAPAPPPMLVPMPAPIPMPMSPPIAFVPSVQPSAPPPIGAPAVSAYGGSFNAPVQAYVPSPIAAPHAAPASIGLRMKTDQPAGYVPAARAERHAGPDLSATEYVQRGPTGGSAAFPWKLAAAAIVVIAAGAGMGRAYFMDRKDTPAAVKTAAPVAAARTAPSSNTGSLVIGSEPAGARVLLDGKPAGQTPLTLEGVAAGRHVLTFVTASGSVKKTVRVEAGKTVSLEVPIFSGWVAVFAPIALDISEKGRSIGTTEQGRLMLTPGRHELTLSNRELGYSSVQTVDIEPGEERSLNVQPMGEMNLNAVPWAEVWIDGQKAGDTPLAHLQIPLGTHEILFKHPQHGERRMTVVVTATAPVASTVDFTKAP